MDVQLYSEVTNTIREEFPVEWRTQVFIDESYKRETVQFATFVLIDGISLRADTEFSIEAIEEFGGLTVCMKLIKAQIDGDIESGLVEEIRKEQANV